VNDILKQRLVGALILVALGVVFWPIIFVEPGEQPAAQQASIPPRPQVDTAPIEAPELAGLRRSPPMAAQQELEQEQEQEAVVSTEPAAEPEKPVTVVEKAPAVVAAQEATIATAPVEQQRTRSEAPEKLALDSDGVPVAWILQVASVSSAQKAEQLRQRLLSMQQKAYVKKVKRGGKDFYRVYIGPKFERAKLEKIQSDVDAEFGVKSMIARYIP